MPNRIADDTTSINAVLARIEAEKQLRYNPPIAIDQTRNVSEFAWDIIENHAGRLEAAGYWHSSDATIGKQEFLIADDHNVRTLMRWVYEIPPGTTETLARQAFRTHADGSTPMENVKRLFARLRRMRVI
jgi:hypothetical protein